MNEAKVLGHLIAAQSALGSMPNEPRVIEFLCRAITHVPGVEDINACWESRRLVPTSRLNARCDNCPNVGGYDDRPCLLKSVERITSLPLSIQNKTLGFINILEDTSGEFGYFKPHITNTINVGLTIIENRRLVKNLESENERHFLALVSNIPGAIYRFRHENGWTIKFLSDKIFEVTGYPASDFVNHASHDLSRVIHPKDHYRLRRAVASAVSDKVPYIVDYRIIHSDGSVRWVHERGQGVFTNEGQLRFLEGALFDITRRKQSEHQLVEARQEAERANRAKSDFLANISHELRTPLNGILGYTQILQNSQNIPADHKHYADIIRQSGEYLLALIEDLLDFSKIEAAILELHTTIFNFPAFLEHIADIFTIRAKEKGIIFELAALSELPKWVSGDEKRLRQVLINLLSNAVKFTERGKVWLKVRHTDDAMDFEIGDTGFGIRAEDLTKIFEPFQQLRHGSIPPTGTGLGLSICEKLVNMMNGRLDITSTIGKGSAFTVRVDLPSASLPGKIKNSPPGDVTVRSNPPGILVVDDNPDNLTMVTELLSSAGYAVRTAAGWRQCLDEVNRLKPDVILMDMVTPGMDGLETTRRLRNSRSLDDVVIIAVSANALEQNQQEGLAAGCNGFVSKPLHLEELLDCLSKHVPGVFQASRAERWRSVVQSKAKAELTKGQVLVAEDNPINLMLINAQLSKIGVTVTKAKDGKQTLALIRQRAFDLIFLDLRMPILDGKQVMEGIKADPGANQHTPIIAITAFATNEERTATAQMGFSDFLIKPILEEKLIGVLTRWFYVPCTENPGSKRNLLRDNSNGSLSFIELMLNKTHRNHRVVQNTLGILFRELPEQQKLAQRALLGRRFEEAREIVHKIHGSASFCEIHGLKNAAQAFERELSRKSRRNVFERQIALTKEINAFMDLKEEILARLAQFARHHS